MRVRWNRNPDTPLPPETPAGKNPPDGAIIDYFLAKNAGGPVTLEILDSSGKLVRKYSSTDKAESLEKIAPKHPIPMYWVREEKILSSEAGMHRFVWDVRFAPPASLGHGYPIAAILHDTPLEPLGALALPGKYTVKLTADGKSYTQPMTLKMDPRIRSSQAELAKQFAMQQAAARGMNESYEALAQVQSARGQVKSLSEKISTAELKQKLADFDKKAAALEGAAVPGFFGTPPSGRQPENFSTLNQRFGRLLGIADAADGAPTTQAESVSAELQSALSEATNRWKALKTTDLASLNDLIEKNGQKKINPEQVAGEVPAADVDGDDEP
jgi:hypothetical protein